MKVTLYIGASALAAMSWAAGAPAADDPVSAPLAAPLVAPAAQPGGQSAAPGTPSAEAPALVRVTSSFEVKHASAVLRQVAKLYSAGFVRRDAERVATEIDGLPAEVSRVWDFSPIHKGASYVLRVRARLDEFGNLDLDFFSAPEMAAAVRSAVDRYLNARGL
jgi:hypothetical protein